MTARRQPRDSVTASAHERLGRFGRLTLLTTCIGLLAACEEGAGVTMPAFLTPVATPSDSAGPDRSTRLVERDVEAPDVVQVTESGLWDGRPSLGGVWVAHPDVRDPERVIIRNTENGSFVIGALFRKERATPGPRLQVSSDAAAALGLLAGQPEVLNVTALRREEAPDPAQVAAAPQPGSLDAPDEITAEPLEQVVTPIEPVEERPAPRAAAAPAEDSAPAARPTGVGAPGPSSATDIAAAALDAAPDTSPPATPLVAPVPTPAPAPAPTPRAPVSNLAKPYIQIGIFSVEQNARNTATAMRTVGLIPTVKPGTSSGKKFWRVVVGPARTGSERAEILKIVKAQGFSDAYAVTN